MHGKQHISVALAYDAAQAYTCVVLRRLVQAASTTMRTFKKKKNSSLVLGVSSRRSPSGFVRSDRIVRESPMPNAHTYNTA